MNAQNLKVAAFYDAIADKYDRCYEGKADYQIPLFLQAEFNHCKYQSGTILDIGCGTGRIKDQLQGQFTYDGIEVSAQMAYRAVHRGYKNVYYGPAEEVLPLRPSKSVDHVIALSSLYFIENIDQIIWESIRIARKSVFVSLEQFDEETRKEFLGVNNLARYNHDPKKFGEAAIFRNQYLWKRPDKDQHIFGDIVHKIIVP